MKKTKSFATFLFLILIISTFFILVKNVSGTVVFASDFETGTTSEWTATHTTTGGSVTVGTSNVYNGTYSLTSSLTASKVDTYGMVYKNITGSGSTIYARGMNFNFANFPASGSDIRVLCFASIATGEAIVYAGVANVSGTAQWFIRGISNGTTFTNYYNTTAAVSPATNYTMELGCFDDNAGWYKLYIDGSLTLDITGVDNNARALNYIWFGYAFSDSAAATTMNVDSIQVSTTYNGPATPEPTPTPTPTPLPTSASGSNYFGIPNSLISKIMGISTSSLKSSNTGGDNDAILPLNYPDATGEVFYGSTQSAYMPWTLKEEVIPRWITLAETYNGTNGYNAYYEKIGNSSSQNNWDEILFKFGNASGTPILIDSFLHGNEYYGEELNFALMTWILNSTSTEAQFIRNNCHILNIPEVNYRWGRTNYNVPAFMTTNDPGDGRECGVNLNRNFSPTWLISLSDNNTDANSGVSADSENESKALHNAWNTYHPLIYWNLHQGANPPFSDGRANSALAVSMNENINSNITTTQATFNVVSGWAYYNGTYSGIGESTYFILFTPLVTSVSTDTIANITLQVYENSIMMPSNTYTVIKILRDGIYFTTLSSGVYTFADMSSVTAAHNYTASALSINGVQAVFTSQTAEITWTSNTIDTVSNSGSTPTNTPSYTTSPTQQPNVTLQPDDRTLTPIPLLVEDNTVLFVIISIFIAIIGAVIAYQFIPKKDVKQLFNIR